MTVFAPIYIDITADTSHSSTPSLRIAQLSLLLALYQKLSPNPQNQNRAFYLNSKILLHLSCHKNGISGSLTFHESKLHVINHNLLLDSVLKNPFYHFHSVFQQFDPYVRSTLHRVAFAFVDWQYHT